MAVETNDLDAAYSISQSAAFQTFRNHKVHILGHHTGEQDQIHPVVIWSENGDHHNGQHCDEAVSRGGAEWGESVSMKDNVAYADSQGSALSVRTEDYAPRN